MKDLKLVIALLIVITAFACTNETEKTESETEKIENPTNRVRLSSEIEWEQLNPARGDQSPQAGTVWGNRKRLFQLVF